MAKNKCNRPKRIGLSNLTFFLHYGTMYICSKERVYELGYELRDTSASSQTPLSTPG